MSPDPFKTTNPTIPRFEPFNPKIDADNLKKAMKGLGTDEAALIRVLGNRNNDQRQEIARQYKASHSKDLVKELKSETSGGFAKLIVALMTPIPEFYSKELKAATVGLGTDENALTEILCTLSNAELEIVKDIYKAENKNSLEDDIKADTSGGFKKLLKNMCEGKRDHGNVIIGEAASADADLLYAAGEGKSGTKEEEFIKILTKRNYAQLQATFKEYEKKTGHSFEKAIKKEFSGDLKDGLLAIVARSQGKETYLAECIHKYVSGAGTNERGLIRILAPRSDIDLQDIKAIYQLKFGKSLESSIKNDTSGDFRKLLVEMVQDI